MKAVYEEYMRHETCPVCDGKTAKTRIPGRHCGEMSNLADLSAINLTGRSVFWEACGSGETHTIIASQILKEIDARLSFLRDVGLDYLTLHGRQQRYPAVSRSVSAWPPRLVPVW